MIDGIRAMSMPPAEEGTHTCPDGTALYTKTWKPSSSALAKIVFVHGFSDHCNAYHDLFLTLALARIEVHAFDQRGWGRSVKTVSERGLTGPTSQVLDDITSILKSQLPTSVPLFLMGHSMGGAEVLHWAATGPAEIRAQVMGYICESPLVAVHEDTQPSKVVVVLGRLAAKVVPRRQLVQKIDSTYLSRDKSVCTDFENDELCHDTGTLEGLAGMLQRAEDLDSGRVPFNDPESCKLWVGHGTEDRVTSFKATERFMKGLNIKDKTFRIYVGHYHKLHAEPGEDKVAFARDVADWILTRSGSSETASMESREVKSRL
ncbi:MAG: hypothetical protein L6R42_008178 [Xanthoria sp. 1 TBL-2021]|nr:MAG: hypothetical protein L6R42_008178 [Xanthoria sp. 1 TBL-2021]